MGNGITARQDDSTDFLTGINWTAFVDLAKKKGAMLWGRRTHEVVRAWGAATLHDLHGVRGIVLTSNQKFRVDEGWEVATSPEEILMRLEKDKVNELLVVGGPAINTAFASGGFIDELILNVESVVVGQGLLLFSPAEFTLPLDLRSVTKLTSTVIQLHYIVGRT